MTDHEDSDMDTGAVRFRVFVNYRRRDTRHVAGRLRDLIVARFGEDSVFVDVESIEPGLDYVTAIDQAVGSCAVMLVLIGDQWLQVSDDQDLRRIDDPADRLRLEVEAGLRHRTRVIPVLVDSASMPKAKDLPTSLAPLARHQATRLRHESFRSDADHLLGVIERVVGGTVKPSDPLPPPAPRPVALWLSFGSLVTVLLALLVLRSGVWDHVGASRPDLPSEEPWASLLWLLPSLPVGVAAWLVAKRKRLGVALGSIAGAVVWVATSLIFVMWREQDPAISAHLVVLALLLAGAAGLLAAAPEMRERVHVNRLDRAFLACVLVVAAIVLRAQSTRIASVITSTERGPTEWDQLLTRPPFWISVLLPVLICLPGALLLCNKVQAQALIALVSLQIVYPVVLRVMTLAVEGGGENLGLAITADLVFLTGCGCMLAAVLVGQRRGAHPT